MAAEITYDVALSFSGAQRDNASALADALFKRNVVVFYDQSQIAKGWGKHLPEYLLDIYSKQAWFCVLFISASYASSIWTTHERRAILDRALKETYEYILPIRFDETELPGLSEGIASVKWTDADSIADLLVEKLIEVLSQKSSAVQLRSHFSLEDTLNHLQDLGNRKNKYNILVLGKEGTGKSSLINYLFGKPIRKVGVGMAVTMPGFHPQDEVLEGMPVSIFDSEGVNTSNVEIWKQSLKAELDKRSSLTPVENWFHTVIYCINAGSSRVDLVDIEIVRQLVDTGHQTMVVFTKSDQSSDEDLVLLRETLLIQVGRKLTTVNVCSNERRFGGIVIPRFGIDDVRKTIVEQSWISIQKRLPARCLGLLEGAVDAWAAKQKEFIGENVNVFSSRSNCHQTVYAEFETFKQQLSGDVFTRVIRQEILHAVNNYSTIVLTLGIKIEINHEALSKLVLGDLISKNIVDDLFNESTVWELVAHVLLPLAVPLPIPIPLPGIALPFRGAILRSDLGIAIDKLAKGIKERLTELNEDLGQRIALALPLRK